MLVVHVGCIIEAQPSKYPSSPVTSSSEDEKLIPAASQSALYTSSGKNSIRDKKESFIVNHQRTFTRGANRARKYSTIASTTVTSTTTTTPTTTLANGIDSDDSCSRKNDGYYQNFGSDCTSYYFCAAGYQLTYVCPPGERFNGKKCDEDYRCPVKPGSNPCGNKPNGYYAYQGGRHPGKYFYCFQKAKVIELQCETGKVFVNGKCCSQHFPQVASGDQVAIVPLDGVTKVEKSPPYKHLPDNVTSDKPSDKEEETCLEKSNGFYTERRSSCTKYYFCINNEKTGLNCQVGHLFNGDLCVHSSRYECPYDSEGNLIQN